MLINKQTRDIQIKATGTEKANINKIKTFQGKLKELSDKDKDKLKNSIIKRGFNTPIFLWNDNILDGHQRLTALKELLNEGWTLVDNEIPVVNIQAKDEKEAAELVLQFNSQYGVITQEGFNMFVTDFNLDLASLQDNINLSLDIDLSFPEPSNKESEDFVIDDKKPAKYDIKRGEIWSVGNHRLMCGDSIKEEDIKKLMNDKTADMVFTDPPYNVNIGWNKFEQNSGRFKDRTIKNDSMSREDFITFTQGYLKTIMNNNQGAIYIFMSCKEWGTIMNEFEKLGGHWSSTIIWNKSNFVLSRKDYHPKFEPILYGWKEGDNIKHFEDRTQSDVWDFNKPSKSEEHPTMKPVELCMKAILNSSEVDNIILDPFGGSGSTLIACEQTKRKCYTMELDPHYCSIIIERWENLTSNKAEKLP